MIPKNLPLCMREQLLKLGNLCVQADSEIQKKELARLKQELEIQIVSNKQNAEIPDRLQDAAFSNYFTPSEDIKAVEDLKDFVRSVIVRKNHGIKSFDTIIILGGNGTGKTHLSISILKEMNYNGLYIASNILCMRLIRSRAFKAAKDEEALIKEYASVPFLIIDEIGRARDLETEQHAIFDILNIRYEKKLPTCLISNKERKDFQDYLGSAVMDRISENYIFVELKAPSYRRMQSQHRHMDAITN
ncbi:ATP-binding protein [Treponema sp. OMZ 799]|uniref:ATP-binding protein n=1 Tax=Treponema sp. OMZ 799 TaxID=2563668 RepID=UPI0020A5D570|nr:ATP-binding protein [Treponema sp. OMZ 799]UTC78123.1 ATP-binding protein [Treponema sp. OMZ 799]